MFVDIPKTTSPTVMKRGTDVPPQMCHISLSTLERSGSKFTFKNAVLKILKSWFKISSPCLTKTELPILALNVTFDRIRYLEGGGLHCLSVLWSMNSDEIL